MSTAAIMLIGNEILSGRTKDQNLPYLGQRFDELGISLIEVRIVRDEPAEIIATVNTLRPLYDYIFTTGGIGPTHDDITTACIADAFGLQVERNAVAEKTLLDWYGEGDVNDARMKMADIPIGAELIDNPVSGAPGFRLENVYVLAGVPPIMQGMFEGIAASLSGGDPVHTRSISAHMRESQIAKTLGAFQDDYPAISIGSYPFQRQGKYGVNIVCRGTSEDQLTELESKIRDWIDQEGYELITA